MDYLTRAKYDHGALRMMLDVQKEILARLAKAGSTCSIWRRFSASGRSFLPGTLDSRGGFF